MAGDKVPTLHSLEKPEDLKQLMRQDRGDDCLSCKIVGNYLSGMSQLEKQRAVILQKNSMFGMRSRKLGIAGISLGLVWMGMWRAFR
ncbi:hypothetical protein PLIIFM63780_002543 [Purpureocillium lilacinum]|uniref:uncharacterized protein n=1 Tax=Purpureocillium lilacinum TaxID=33203 RepID=UPI00208119EA|nr:hypothetical protein PLICBS_004925 [Purpureocillium lilacinum]GJN79032.1 hypothetical protein PLIIFM63780_002543 [Purpureocillium lilacinum]